MQVYVCIKHVPDTAANIKIAGDAGYDTSSLKFIVNPYDEYAVEQAVQTAGKDGEVVVVTVGPDAAAGTMRSALAMGAHRGILVKADAQFLDSDLTAQALKAAIEQDGKKPDIIFTGKGAVDTEGFQTLYRLAAAMNLPVVNEIVKMNTDGGKVTVEREIGGGSREVLELPTPCVLGATKGLNEPRYPKFPDIMKAKKKALKELALSDLGIDAGSAKTELLKLEAAPERSGAKLLEGDLKAQVTELVRILKEEEKVL